MVEKKQGQEILVARAACCIVNNHDSASEQSAQCSCAASQAFKADAASLTETLERLSPVGEEGDMCILERVDTDTMGKELRKRSRAAHERGAVYFACIQGAGCLVSGTIHVQCRGEWVSAETIAEHIMPENPDDASSVLIINTVDSGALSQQDVGLGDGWRVPRGVEVLWGIWPELVDFARDDGSVLGQLVPHIIDIQGESMPVADLLKRVASIFTWYTDQGKGEEAPGISREKLPARGVACCRSVSGGGPMVRFSLGRVAQPSFYPTGNTLRDRDGFLMGAKQWNTESRHTLSVKVHIESRTEGAEVFYTIDGTDPVPFEGPRPESSSTRRYTRKPVALNFDEDGFKNFSLRAVAVCPGLLPSKIGESPVYTVQGKVKIVKFTEVRREDMVMLSMECATPGARIHYEESGRYPTVHSLVYTTPIRVHTRTVHAMAVAPGQTDSSISVFKLLDQVATPTIHAEGTIVPADQVHDTAEGVPVYLDKITVTFSNESSDRKGFRTFYTTDGTTPSPKSVRYTGPILVDGAGVHTFTVVAFGDMMADSEIVQASFTILNRVSPPVIEPASGIHRERVGVTVSCQTPDSTIYWTLDGSEPVIGAPNTRVYTGHVVLDRTVAESFAVGGLLEAYTSKDGRPIQVEAKAIARAPGMVDSKVTDGRYSILEVVKMPTLDPRAGMYCEYVVVTMSCETPDTTILYVVGDGEGPQRGGANTLVYEEPIKVQEVGWTTFRCKAVKNGMWESEELTQKYGIEAQIMAWGLGDNGRLGTGAEASSGRPVRGIVLDNIITSVAAGPSHTVFIDDHGKVLTCGMGMHGRLGHGDSNDVSIPKMINGLNDIVIKQVSLGERHTLLLSNEGRVYACGDGAFGQLGIGGYGGATEPREIEALSPGKKMVDGHLQSTPPVVFVSAGGFHSCAVFKGGQGVSAWGRGGEGQLGNEERFTIDLPKKMTSRILDDGEHEGLYGQKIQQVACGLWHTIILTTSGLLFACGRAMEGQLGIEEPFPYVLLPCRLHSLYKDRVIMTSIAAGKDHTIALDNKKRVWAWGSNANGQLGVGKFEAEAGKDLPISEVPRLVSGLEDVDVQEIFCSAETSAVLDAKGRLFTWGKGKCMSLGTMDEEDVFEPGQMAALDGFSIVHIGVGDKHMVALMNSASSNKQVVRTASVSSTGTHSHGRGSPDSQGKQSAYAGGSPSSDTQRQDSPTPAGGGSYTSIQAYGQGVGKGGAEVTSILGGMFGGGGSRSEGQRGAMA